MSLFQFCGLYKLPHGSHLDVESVRACQTLCQHFKDAQLVAVERAHPLVTPVVFEGLVPAICTSHMCPSMEFLICFNEI